MLSPADKLLVDRYFDNSLTGVDLNEFLNRLETDDRFRKNVSFHHKLIDGIQESEDQRLHKLIIDATGYRKSFVPQSLKMIIAFLVITGAGIVIWEYVGPGSGARNKIFTWNFNRPEKKKDIVAPVVMEKLPVEKQPDTSTSVAGISETENLATADSSTQEDIVVRKDQMLVTYTLHPIRIDLGNENAQAAAEQVAESPEKLNSFDVEFWVSPVNYKGYKLQGEKLILFGIEMPDEVQLYDLNAQLWMKYGSEFYQLQAGDNFESLIQSGNVPTALR